MRRYVLLAAAFAAMWSCRKEDKPVPASDNTISALKCYVYYDLSSWSLKQELDVLGGGTYNAGMGAISYTFPDDPEKYNAQTLSRCRLEASIPATARLVETGADGSEIGGGLGGLRNLAGATVYFKVMAADGTEKKYQATFKLNTTNQ